MRQRGAVRVLPGVTFGDLMVRRPKAVSNHGPERKRPLRHKASMILPNRREDGSSAIDEDKLTRNIARRVGGEEHGNA